MEVVILGHGRLQVEIMQQQKKHFLNYAELKELKGNAALVVSMRETSRGSACKEEHTNESKIIQTSCQISWN